MNKDVERFNDIIERYDEAIFHNRDVDKAINCCFEFEHLLFPYVSDKDILLRFNERKEKALKSRKIRDIIRWGGTLINLAKHLELIIMPEHLKEYCLKNKHWGY